MTQESDIENVKIAISHLYLCIKRIEKVEKENITRQEHNSLNITIGDIKNLMRRMKHLIGEDK